MDAKSPIYQYAVESGIPIAPTKRSKYPLHIMEVGQSFAFEAADIERVRQYVFQFARKHKPMKFKVSVSHLRVWRTA